MNNVFTNIAMLTIGAAVGSLVTWKLLKTKYEKIAKEEIDSVKEVFSRRKTETENEKEAEVEENESKDSPESDESEYNEIIKNNRYSNREKEYIVKKGPRVIRPDEFGEIDEYETLSLCYYADKVLTDFDDNIIDDVEETVGVDSLTRFGEYEDDSVFVRNDERKIDYEILLDERNYKDVYPDDSEE